MTLNTRHSSPVPIGLLSPENNATMASVPASGACVGAVGATDEGVAAPGGAAIAALGCQFAAPPAIARAKTNGLRAVDRPNFDPPRQKITVQLPRPRPRIPRAPLPEDGTAITD